MNSRPRTDSNWRVIRVVDEDGSNQAVYVLDKLGRLQEKLGRQKNRRLKNSHIDVKIPTSASPQIVGNGYSINDLNKGFNNNKNIIDEESNILNTKQSLNLNIDSKIDLMNKEDQNTVNDKNLDFPIDFFVKDDFFEMCGDALENFYDVGNLFNDQENLEFEPFLNDQF